ncbi:related to ribulose-5-phosphate 4-epimerase and related epimerases and aldolases [Phialocephala subalpina]|uniref:Related to ribulose-5-phosphate 4-epimerase and related epimerases and aldolases n=1 Tax=Phialocephala subalpina TaxID=576137 RepID=A0A1L7XMT7_9HELO|nr:related to ribulose-5-phosphate 4-epimerase and related epimerases and aldolases [Phialocephala subalpina]
MAPAVTEVASHPAIKPTYKSGDPSLTLPEDVPTGPPTFTDKYEERKYLKHRLALAFRIFAKFGFCEGVAGHITLRDPVDPQNFWVNPFGRSPIPNGTPHRSSILGLHFSLITPDDLILVSHDGKVIGGGRNRFLNYAAFAIHSEIHTARPDVVCAAHSHSTFGRAFCATGRTLDPITQDSCVFYNDHVLYPTFAGVVLASDEGKHIAAALGNKKAILLGNHGLLTAARSIEETVAYFVLLDKCCEVQLAADASAAGSGKPLVMIGHEEAVSTWRAVGTKENGYFQGLPLFQTVEHELGERTFLGRGVEPLYN